MLLYRKYYNTYNIRIKILSFIIIFNIKHFYNETFHHESITKKTNYQTSISLKFEIRNLSKSL